MSGPPRSDALDPSPLPASYCSFRFPSHPLLCQPLRFASCSRTNSDAAGYFPAVELHSEIPPSPKHSAASARDNSDLKKRPQPLPPHITPQTSQQRDPPMRLTSWSHDDSHWTPVTARSTQSTYNEDPTSPWSYHSTLCLAALHLRVHNIHPSALAHLSGICSSPPMVLLATPHCPDAQPIITTQRDIVQRVFPSPRHHFE